MPSNSATAEPASTYLFLIGGIQCLSYCVGVLVSLRPCHPSACSSRCTRSRCLNGSSSFFPRWRRLLQYQHAATIFSCLLVPPSLHASRCSPVHCNFLA